MRIISKFHDYYDSVMKTGSDQETIFFRSKIEHKLEQNPYPQLQSSYGNRFNFSIIIVGFCGEIYKAIKVEDHSDMFGNRTTHYFYDLEELKKYSIEKNIAIDWETSNKKRSWSTFWNFKYGKDLKRHLEEFDTSKLKNIFVEKNIPYFLYEEKKLIECPTLKEIEFFKVKDTFSCYQDIYQFVSGVLNQKENPMVQISNQDKIDKHGFDKYSFRKMPSK